MSFSRANLALALAAALMYACVQVAAAAPAAAPDAHGAHGTSRSPLSSRQLWATVNVCNPHDQPNTVGIRGSMPGDGNAKNMLYMRFQVQYLDPVSKSWAYVKQGADSGFVKVGAADVARQAGRSFQFAHAEGKPAFTLRGVVSFQWRRGTSTLLSTSRVTSAGRTSSAGSDPKGYSAASCTLP